MSKRVEQFIKDHRDEFDTEVPAPAGWNKLKRKLEEKHSATLVRNLFLKSWGMAAATIALAALLAFYLISRNTKITNPTLAQLQSTRDNAWLNEINPSVAKEVNHFTQIIELQQHELKKLQSDDSTLYREFVGDITKLDSSYNALKKELPENPNREQLLEAMIQNLRLQTDLLNEQLLIIQKIKQLKIKKNETNSKNI